MKHALLLLVASIFLVANVAHAEDGHGPSASRRTFPSHRFSRAPHPREIELDFHYGLTQPILLRGFNAAVDVRYKRLIVSYSHGHGLLFSNPPGALTRAEERAGLRVFSPYSTGGGVGVTLIDELYLMADLKVHRFEASAGAEVERYTTLTAGAEIGWRFFIWKGLHVTPVLRYWPTVWDNAPKGRVRVNMREGGQVEHEPMGQGVGGLFANVLVGWAFNLGDGP